MNVRLWTEVGQIQDRAVRDSNEGSEEKEMSEGPQDNVTAELAAILKLH